MVWVGVISRGVVIMDIMCKKVACVSYFSNGVMYGVCRVPPKSSQLSYILTSQ